MKLTAFLPALLHLCSLQAEDSATIFPTPPSGGANNFYQGNRAPLLPGALVKLPLGSVRPEGYLRHQLELMAQGFTGRLTEISSFCRREGNAWVNPGGSGHSGWEEAPYWLRGYYNLGYVLNDPRILKEANFWLEGVLATQRPDGWFGSQSNLVGDRLGLRAPDLWPNMVMLFPLRSLYEVTGDRRILDFMSKYFRWQMTLPLDRFTPFSWQHWRAGDNLDTIYWLYNRTGDSRLLDLARVNHERTANWVGDIPTWHVVNIAECFREPAQYYQQTKDVRYLRAAERVYDTVRGIYGQVPGGMYGADENARPGFDGPRQGTESCAFVEMLYSDYLLTAITGSVLWADRAEEIAFNQLPPSMTPDLKGLHYLTAPNQIQLDRASKSPYIQNGGDMFSYNPHQYRCCQHNVAFGWPYFIEHLWMATQFNGLAVVLYAPSVVTARAGDGAQVKIVETTSYPFGDTVDFAISASKPSSFPLTLRIPGWCRQPKLSVNGKPLGLPAAAGWAVVNRLWANGDKVRLELPARVTITEWTKNRNTVSVHRGPLIYSLRIGERWEKKEGTAEWPGFEVYPTTPWNYGLVVDKANPESSFRFERIAGALPAQPFALDAPPLVLKARGRRIPEWKQEANGIIAEVQMSPVRSDAPEEEITLVPAGSARLRITAFPQIGAGHTWNPEPRPVVVASRASHFLPSPRVVLDGGSRFVWPDQTGGYEWIELNWAAPRTISTSDVRWVDEKNIKPPESHRLLAWDGARWQSASLPVATTRLRLELKCQARATAGISSWQLR
jgi:DUF1680 family protein